MHPDDALRPLRRLGDLGNGERRGVRSEHRIGSADPVELGKDLPLELELLEHRLDHEVALRELA